MGKIPLPAEEDAIKMIIALQKHAGIEDSEENAGASWQAMSEAQKREWKDKLPDQPSALLALALKDLIIIEGNKRYSIEMGGWHEDRGAICEVCMAGAVMAQTIKVPLRRKSTEMLDPVHTFPGDFSLAVYNKLAAINYLRGGDVSTALTLLGLKSHLISDRRIHTYHFDPTHFKADIQHLIDDLKAAGL